MIERFSSKLLFLIYLPLFIFGAFGEEPQVEVEKAPWNISSIPADGSWIILEDGTLYEISPPDWQIVKRWSDGRTHPHDVKVINTKNLNFDYPIDIYNKHTNETVQARYPKTIEVPAEEAPSEDDESD